MQGIPVCFDAKECAEYTFALQNVHAHQVQFMEDFEAQGGIAFLLISYKKEDCYYYLRFAKLKEFWIRMEQGGRKSFRFDELETDFFLPKAQTVFVPYLPMIQKDLNLREE